LSIEYFFKGYSLKYARSGFKNHFLPGNGCGRAKIGSCVFHSSLLLYKRGPDENAFSSGPLLYRRYAYPAEGQVSYFCNFISFLPYFFRKESLFSCFVLPLRL